MESEMEKCSIHIENYDYDPGTLVNLMGDSS